MNFQDSKIHFWVFHVGFRRFKRQPLKVAALRWQVLTASVERLHLANWQNADLLLVTVTLVAANRLCWLVFCSGSPLIFVNFHW